MSSVLIVLSGWTGVILALLAFAVALRRSSPALGLLAALLSAPFCLFVNGYPIIGALAWAALISNFIAACIVGIRRDVAFAALTPFAVICVFLAVLAARGITLAHRDGFSEPPIRTRSGEPRDFLPTTAGAIVWNSL